MLADGNDVASTVDICKASNRAIRLFKEGQRCVNIVRMALGVGVTPPTLPPDLASGESRGVDLQVLPILPLGDSRGVGLPPRAEGMGGGGAPNGVIGVQASRVEAPGGDQIRAEAQVVREAGKFRPEDVAP